MKIDKFIIKELRRFSDVGEDVTTSGGVLDALRMGSVVWCSYRAFVMAVSLALSDGGMDAMMS